MDVRRRWSSPERRSPGHLCLRRRGRRDVRALGAAVSTRYVHGPGGAVETGDDGHVADVDGRRGVEPDAAVQAGVVEEVVEVELPAALRRRPRRTPGGIDCQVSTLLTTTVTRFSAPAIDVVGDVGLEGRIAALVPTTWVPFTQTTARWVAESKRRTIRSPAQPRGTRTVLWYQTSPTWSRTRGVREEVVVAGRHRHLAGAGEWAVPPALGATDAFGVEAELPDPVERPALAAHRVLGSKPSTHLPAETMACWTRCCAAATISSTQ